MGDLERNYREGRGAAAKGLKYFEVLLHLPCDTPWSRWAGELVATEDWVPHMPITPEGCEVYASQFTLGFTRWPSM